MQSATRSLRLEIITAERIVLSEEMVTSVRVPSAEGVVGILPRHAPLMTTLAPGELIMRRGEEEESFFVTGGFLEVRNNHIAVLADASERAEEIDLSRAEEARNRAEAELKEKRDSAQLAAAEAAMRRALIRLRLAQQARRRRGSSQVQ
jgi:F-type H+-transporting ATPase subunit epsilon